jgi:glycosyltransferase involved in cell wall biosynthesis
VQGEVASAICLPSLAFRPSIVTFNGLNLLRRVTGRSRSAALANLRLVVRAATRTICVSEDERGEVSDVVGARAARRVVQIHNGVAPASPPDPGERAAARAALGLGPTVTVVAWLAGLDDVKDPDVAVRATIEAARSGARVMLVMAGDGPLRGEIERATVGPGGDAVRLLGFRRHTRQVLAASDVFVLSSKREGFSFSLLEAMSIGLPVVVSDAPANVEAVGDAGLIAPRGDVSAFASAFRRLAGEEGLRLTLGVSARRRVTELFGAAEMTRRTQALYDAVARRDDPGPR